jgi:protein phosphatase
MTELADQPASQKLASIRYAVQSDVGKKREENQDSYGIVDGESLKAFLIADGMGGARGGSVASGLAVDLIKSKLRGQQIDSCDQIISVIQEANKVIAERAALDASLTGMGTTLVGVIFTSEKTFVVNIGDSRLYGFESGELVPFTEDHTLVQELLRSGAIRPEQAKNHPVAHMLTRSLGPSADLKVDCFELEKGLFFGQKFLLCTDGLYNQVSSEELREVIRQQDLEHALKVLVDLANERGGPDNITALLVELGEGFPKDPNAEDTLTPLNESGAIGASSDGVESGEVDAAKSHLHSKNKQQDLLSELNGLSDKVIDSKEEEASVEDRQKAVKEDRQTSRVSSSDIRTIFTSKVVMALIACATAILIVILAFLEYGTKPQMQGVKVLSAKNLDGQPSLNGSQSHSALNTDVQAVALSEEQKAKVEKPDDLAADSSQNVVSRPMTEENSGGPAEFSKTEIGKSSVDKSNPEKPDLSSSVSEKPASNSAPEVPANVQNNPLFSKEINATPSQEEREGPSTAGLADPKSIIRQGEQALIRRQADLEDKIRAQNNLLEYLFKTPEERLPQYKVIYDEVEALSSEVQELKDRIEFAKRSLAQARRVRSTVENGEPLALSLEITEHFPGIVKLHHLFQQATTEYLKAIELKKADPQSESVNKNLELKLAARTQAFNDLKTGAVEEALSAVAKYESEIKQLSSLADQKSKVLNNKQKLKLELNEISSLFDDKQVEIKETQIKQVISNLNKEIASLKNSAQ